MTTRRSVSRAIAGLPLLGFIDGPGTSELFFDPAFRQAERLVGAYGPAPGFELIARAYLGRQPRLTDLDALLVHLPNERTVICLGMTDERASLREALRQQVMDDYAEERIAVLKGWVFSATECRLCALAELVHSTLSASR